MARPQKEGLDYFPHDTDAASDEKVEALRSQYGNDGYAFYFILCERIYRTQGAELDISMGDTREEMLAVLSRKVAVPQEKFEAMLATALKWGLFDKAEYAARGVLTSNGIKKRAGVVTEKRERERDRYKKDRDIPAAETTQKPDISAAETTQKRGVSAEFLPHPVDKGKERKEKERKEDGGSTRGPDPAAADLVTEGLGEAVRAYEKNIHPPSPMNAEMMADWLAKGMAPGVLVFAIEQAAQENVRKASYINGILRALYAEGVTTLEGVEARERERATTRAGKQAIKQEQEQVQSTGPSMGELERGREIRRQLRELEKGTVMPR